MKNLPANIFFNYFRAQGNNIFIITWHTYKYQIPVIFSANIFSFELVSHICLFTCVFFFCKKLTKAKYFSTLIEKQSSSELGIFTVNVNKRLDIIEYG